MNPRTGPIFPVRRFRLTGACILGAALLWGAGSAGAQAPAARVSGLVRDDIAVRSSKPGDLCLRHFGNLSESDRLGIGDELFAGDLVKAGPCGGGRETPPEAPLLVELTCADEKTRLILSGDFRAVVQPRTQSPDSSPGPRPCVLELKGGTVDVVTRGNARIGIGDGVWLGSEGTLYSVSAPDRRAEEPDPWVCSVFEGVVRVDRPDTAPVRIDAGSHWSLGTDLKTTERRDIPHKRSLGTAVRLAAFHGEEGMPDQVRRAASKPLRLFYYMAVEPTPPGDGHREQLWLLSNEYMIASFEDPDALEEALARLGKALEIHDLLPSPNPETAPIPGGEPLTHCAADLDGTGILTCNPPGDPAPTVSQIRLATVEGWARLTLPADPRAGETVSGRLTVGVAGKKPDKNRKKLDPYSVIVGDVSLPFRDGPFTVELPEKKTLRLQLANPRGKVQAEEELPLGAEPRAVPELFSAPTFCPSGRELRLVGPFDGNLTNTAVAWNDGPLSVLHEVPGMLTVQCPDLPGSGPLSVTEQWQRVELADFRVLAYSIDIPVEQLKKGTTTTASVRIAGLQGFRHPLGLVVHNSNPQSVRIDGARQGQSLMMQPSAWAGTETLTRSFELTAKKPGSARFAPQLVPLRWVYMSPSPP